MGVESLHCAGLGENVLQFGLAGRVGQVADKELAGQVLVDDDGSGFSGNRHGTQWCRWMDGRGTEGTAGVLKLALKKPKPGWQLCLLNLSNDKQMVIKLSRMTCLCNGTDRGFFPFSRRK